MLGDDTTTATLPAKPAPKATAAPSGPALLGDAAPASSVGDALHRLVSGKPIGGTQGHDPINAAVSSGENWLMTKTPAGGIFDALVNRPVQAAHAKIGGGQGYFDTLLHGDPNADANAAKFYSKLGINPSDTIAPVAEAAADTIANPLSLLGMPIGDMTPAARLTQAAEQHGLPAAMKAGEALNKLPGGQAVTAAAAKAHDFLGVHSAAKRALATEHGPEWLQKYAESRSAHMNASRKSAEEMDSFLKNHPGLVARVGKDEAMRSGPRPRKSSFGDSKVNELMSRDEDRSLEASPLTKAGRLPADIMTAGLFAQPLGHMANISALGALVDPGAVASALGRGTVNNLKKVVGKGETDAAREQRLAGPMQHGAVGGHPERDNPLDTGLRVAGEAAEKVPLAGKALAMVPKALRGLYRASGDILWKFDDEVKANRYQHLVDGGMNPDMAGLRVGGELVDYENKSPVAKNLRPMMPFASWRTKAPLAVLRNAIENPGRTTALAQLAPAIFGGKQNIGDQTYTSSLPGAETAELTSGPVGAMKYAASSFGPWPRFTGDIFGALTSAGAPDTKRGEAAKKKARTQFTYGQEPLTYLLNEAPLAGRIMQMTDKGMFSHGQVPSSLQDLMSLIGFRPTP